MKIEPKWQTGQSQECARNLRRRNSPLQLRGMIVFSDRGPISIDASEVAACYRGGGDGRYTHCTLVLLGGREIEGAIANAALRDLEARLADSAPPLPPMAA
jgi:hypothetical protein